MWRRHQSKRASEAGSAEWEPIFTANFPSGVQTIDFASKTGNLVIHLATGEVALVAEALLRRKLVANVSAIQLSNREAVVERDLTTADGTSKPIVFSLKSSINIKGMDASSKHALVWNGKQCEVYTIPESAPSSGADDGTMSPTATSPPLKMLTSLKLASAELAMGNDSIFACSDNAVLVHNISGLVKHTINFAEADGTPTLLDCNGKFLAVATSGMP
jgi:hypothetical protein